jgi:hypothetical protein
MEKIVEPKSQSTLEGLVIIAFEAAGIERKGDSLKLEVENLKIVYA